MQVNYGESLKLVGSGSELGDWNVEAAPEMQWTDGDVWVADVELPADQEVHFKVGRSAVPFPEWLQDIRRPCVCTSAMVNELAAAIAHI